MRVMVGEGQLLVITMKEERRLMVMLWAMLWAEEAAEQEEAVMRKGRGGKGTTPETRL